MVGSPIQQPLGRLAIVISVAYGVAVQDAANIGGPRALVECRGTRLEPIDES